MRKALILTRDFPPLVTSGASRAWKFASNLVTIGWEPIVIAPPSIATMEATMPSGSNRIDALHRTGPDVDAAKLEPCDRCALLHGRPVEALRPFSAKVTGLFRDNSDGAVWEKNASILVERQLAENPDIDLLYAQGPPLEPLELALETARKHSLTVVLDITSPLDPAMPAPGTTSSSTEAKAEERILLSGVPMITPTRALKEYYLKKYLGRLEYGAMSIVPHAFDATHPAFKPRGSKGPSLTMRIALLAEEVSRSELKALFSGLESWVKSDGIRSGDIELTIFGEGAPEIARRAARSPLKTLLVLDEEGGIGKQFENCRNADVFCALLGRTPANTCAIPDRMVDALGMGVPLCAIHPDGVAAKMVMEAGGVTAAAGDAGAIAGLFRSVYSAWRTDALQRPPADLVQRHAIGAVIQELTRAIAWQYLR